MTAEFLKRAKIRNKSILINVATGLTAVGVLVGDTVKHSEADFFPGYQYVPVYEIGPSGRINFLFNGYCDPKVPDACDTWKPYPVGPAQTFYEPGWFYCFGKKCLDVLGNKDTSV